MSWEENRRQRRRIALRVGAAHLAVLGLVAAVPALKGCFRPRRPREIVTFVEFASLPAPQVETVSRLPEPKPKPVPPAPREVAPPEPKPAPVPKPPPKKSKPKPRPVPKKTSKPKPKKKKWKPVSPEQIKLGKRVGPSRPALSESEIRKELSAVSAAWSAGGSGEINEYLGRVRAFFYRRWTPPAAAPPGATVTVRFYLDRSGRIVKWKKISGSGDAVYDKSVLRAVSGVTLLPRPPARYPYDYVEVEFAAE